MTKRLFKLLGPIDIITFVYIGWILLYMLLGHAHAVDFHIHFPIHLSLVALIFLIAYWQNSLTQPESFLYKALRLLRGVYPLLLFGYFFTSGYAVNRIVFHEWQDAFFMAIDQKLFGYLPALVWGQKYGSFWLNELFHAAYFAYYPMIAGLPLYLYFKKPKGFSELIFCLCFTFYLCYIIYSVLPVIGGRYLPEAMELSQFYRGGLFTHIMVTIYRLSHHLGGAFPSSHVAVAIVLSIGALRHIRPLGYLFSLISFFLFFSTVYCHYHWFIDAVFGLFTGIMAYYLALSVHRKLQGISP